MTSTPIPITLNSGQWQNYGAGYAGLTGRKNADNLCNINGFIKPVSGGGSLTADTPVTVAGFPGSAPIGEVSGSVPSPCTIAAVVNGTLQYFAGVCFLTYEDFIAVQSPVTCTPRWVAINLTYTSTD